MNENVRLIRDGLITLLTGRPPRIGAIPLTEPEVKVEVGKSEKAGPAQAHGPDVEIQISASDVRSRQEIARVKLQVIDHKLRVLSTGGHRSNAHRNRKLR